MLKDVVGYLRSTIALPLRYTRKPSRVSMLFAELASGDAALAEFHSHNFVEGAPKIGVWDLSQYLCFSREKGGRVMTTREVAEGLCIA